MKHGNTILLIIFISLQAWCQAAITLDFNVNGEDTFSKVFKFVEVSDPKPLVADVGATFPCFTLPSNNRGLSGVIGPVQVTVIGKDKLPAENAANWTFGANAVVHSGTKGLGVASTNETGGETRLVDGEAFILRFDLSHVDVTAGMKLVFRVKSGDGETYRIFQRTGSAAGTTVFAMSSKTPAVFSDSITINSGFSPSPFIYEFAMTDAGWDGGNLLRITNFTLDVEAAPLPTPAPSRQPLFTSADSEIVLDFSVDGTDAVKKIFKFKDVGSTTPVVLDDGATTPVFKLSPSSEYLVGATGSLTVTWTGKDKSGPTNATTWTFGPNAIVNSDTEGIGVQSSGEVGGYRQFGVGEALILSFNTSNLKLYPGSKLVFTVLGGAQETYRVFQRTGANSAKEVFAMEKFVQAVPSDIILVTGGYLSTSGVFEFAIVDAGWAGGSFMRFNRFSVGVVGTASATSYFPPRFHPIFTDNMVLQRNDSVAIYGRGTPGNAINVTFGATRTNTTVDSTGFWYASLSPMAASYTARTLTATDGIQTVAISNVLVGDVWLCSGQSNMDRPFSTFSTLSTTGKDNPNIRLAQLVNGGKNSPSDDLTLSTELGASWQECTSSYLLNFSPGAYFFAARMEPNASVPIGLIDAAVGATLIQDWTPVEVLNSLGFSKQTYGQLYNGMIHPLRRFTFKGILWYQGESNTEEPVLYAQVFPAMIQSWRASFGRGNIPFYFAQMAAKGDRTWDVLGTSKPFFREAQQAALSLSNTRMIVLMDAGEFTDVHPQNKMAVGERFARHALKAAGNTKINTDSPTFSSLQTTGGKAVITFVNVGGGLETRDLKMNYNPDYPQGLDPQAFAVTSRELSGFTIAGANQVFVDANATITASNKVTVWSQYVPNPVAVRYCFVWFGLCNLYASNDGWVATPFRTDNFPIPLPENFYGITNGTSFEGNTTALGSGMTPSLSTGSSTIKAVTIAGINGYQVSGTGQRQVFLSTSNPAFQNGPTPYVLVKILFYDQGSGQITFSYDGTAGIAIGPLNILLQNTLKWRVASAVLYDASFRKQLSNQDLRIECSGSNMVIGGVYLSGAPSP